MADGLSRLGITPDELRQAIAQDGKVNAALNDFMDKDVVAYARSMAPVDSGAYAASIKVIRKSRRGKGRVSATNYKAAWIEFGTGEPGPTNAHAPMEKAANHFGGTLDGGITDEKDAQ